MDLISFLDEHRNDHAVGFDSRDELRAFLYEFLNPEIRDEAADRCASDLWDEHGDKLVAYLKPGSKLLYFDSRRSNDRTIIKYSIFQQSDEDEIEESEVLLENLFMK